MKLNDILNALYYTGKVLGDRSDAELVLAMHKAYTANQWFTPENIGLAVDYWSKKLTPESLQQWIDREQITDNAHPKTVGIIAAGNIPLVGLHDIISVLITGNKVVVKPSSEDEELITFFVDTLIQADPEMAGYIQTAERIEKLDAVIATGSNNTARYFEYYFSKYPNVIRKNRNSIAVLTGNESPETMTKIAGDITGYFGKGCRNVTQVWLPKGFDIVKFIDNTLPYGDLINHNKYANNYVYHRALLLMNMDAHLDNGFMLFREDEKIYAPIGTVNYAFYEHLDDMKAFVAEHAEEIQCVVSEADLGNVIAPGETQNPALWDYADGVNTIEFLKGI